MRQTFEKHEEADTGLYVRVGGQLRENEGVGLEGSDVEEVRGRRRGKTGVGCGEGEGYG